MSFTIKRSFTVPVLKVWEAITHPLQMRQWYFDIPDFKAKVGFEFSFEGGEKNQIYIHRCTIMEVVPFKKLCYTWLYQGYTGKSLVCFELFAGVNTTTLKLTHTGLESFPEDNPDFSKENFEKGWEEIIGTSLKKFLHRH